MFLKGLDFSKTEFTKRRRGDKELGPALLSESGHSAFAIYSGIVQRSETGVCFFLNKGLFCFTFVVRMQMDEEKAG